MDLQRYLLIGAIAVLSFMLLTEWSNFQDERATAAATAEHQARRESQLAPVTVPTGEIPQVEPVATGNHDPNGQVEDIPQSVELPGTEELASPVVQTASNHRIRIQTDVLDLVIDPLGGDIVYAAFPQHASSLKTPDVPFTLLEDSGVRTYVAQSGLIGPNGVDTPAGRAQYKSAAS